jgi:hypothetical protein
MVSGHLDDYYLRIDYIYADNTYPGNSHSINLDIDWGYNRKGIIFHPTLERVWWQIPGERTSSDDIDITYARKLWDALIKKGFRPTTYKEYCAHV